MASHKDLQSRSRRSLTVGVLLPALDNDFHLAIIGGVEAALRTDGVSVLVCTSGPAAGAAVEFLRGKTVGGIIAVPLGHDLDALRQAEDEGIPVVAIDWIAAELDTDRVVLDNGGAGAAVARHLVDHGHRHVAMVSGDERVSTMRERAEGFRQALVARSVDIDESRITAAPLTVEGGGASAERP
ncbi:MULTISPECIES: LacI family DNA-binding transcriptional regulator [unclassified Rathayibacter]|uniref:LacI family DNA-binding transcriptional regulator n=1 Tax=unclassified Rathayibacter TaxID=2609250 RepID=UPI000FB99A97|nr:MULTISPECIES: substrate-binding domain-containing protein [unclassified Rathayibacter]ROP49130.1 LacI family sugar-binding protein [Rathayibacter sp. PhB186]ROS50753.1 LacI family sugar-binding protein [Rathayibacter sp. PhB185]